MKVDYRRAVLQDAPRIAEIYKHYVDHSVWTFRTTCPEAKEYAKTIEEGRYPFWVAEGEAGILGFACAERLRPHDAYLWDVELTIYLQKDAPQGMGMGKELYRRLLGDLTEQGFLNAYAIITGSNERSLVFHQRLGFAQVAHFPKMGYKHGAWHDVVWMQKVLTKIEGEPELPLPFREK